MFLLCICTNWSDISRFLLENFIGIVYLFVSSMKGHWWLSIAELVSMALIHVGLEHSCPSWWKNKREEKEVLKFPIKPVHSPKLSTYLEFPWVQRAFPSSHHIHFILFYVYDKLLASYDLPSVFLVLVLFSWSWSVCLAAAHSHAPPLHLHKLVRYFKISPRKFH